MEYLDQMTRYKLERSVKKEKKKAIKVMTARLGGDKKEATILVEEAVKKIATEREKALNDRSNS